jgi:tRNA (cmo5U34)-methyltransferase
VGNQWHFDPDSYLAMVRGEIPDYDDLQAALVEATRPVRARAILDLGSGTGVTAHRVLAAHPGASLVGLDASPSMLAHPRALVPRASFRVGRLEDPLPRGSFDLVVSAFAIHHLDAAAKSRLFTRVASALSPGGRFVACDVVVPTRVVARPVPLEPGIDLPSGLDQQIGWLRDAGLDPDVVLAYDDLAVFAAGRAPG